MITHRQRDCLKLIAEAVICPSYREIADAMGFKSKCGVSRLLRGLEERGMINRIKNRSRAIEVTTKGKSFLSGIQMEPDFEAYVDNLMHSIRADLYILKCGIRHDDPKDEIVVRINDIEKLIKKKWTEK